MARARNLRPRGLAMCDALSHRWMRRASVSLVDARVGLLVRTVFVVIAPRMLDSRSVRIGVTVNVAGAHNGVCPSALG